MEVPIIDFLNEHQIKYLPINIRIDNGKKTRKTMLCPSVKNYTSSDFKQFDFRQCKERFNQFKVHTNWIQIDTTEVNQIDIDLFPKESTQEEKAKLIEDWNKSECKKNLDKNHAHYLSLTKGLPHYFIKKSKIPEFSIPFVFDHLKSTCGWANWKDTKIYNGKKPLAIYNMGREILISDEDDDASDDDNTIDNKMTITSEELSNLMQGLPEDSYRCGPGNYCFNIVCALKKMNVPRNIARKHCARANHKFDSSWFNGVWNQKTLHLAYDQEYIRSKSSFKLGIPKNKCLINPSLLTDDLPKKKENIHDIIWGKFKEWVIKNKIVRLDNSDFIAKKLNDYHYEIIGDGQNWSVNDTINKFASDNNELFEGSGLRAKRDNLSVFLSSQQPAEWFPICKYNINYIGYKNGLYDLKNNEFIEKDFPKNILCRTYFDEDYKPLDEIPPDLKKIFDLQDFDDDTIDLLLAMIGRGLYPVGTDKWGKLLCLCGLGDTGKTTLLLLIQKALRINKVCTFSVGDKSSQFALGGKDKYELIIISEAENLPKSLTPEQIKCISRGELVELEQKRKDPYYLEWSVPIVMSSNGVLKFKDDSGACTKRISYFMLENVPEKPDQKIKANLIKLIPRLIPLFVNKYFAVKDDDYKETKQMTEWITDIELESDLFVEWLNGNEKDSMYQINYSKSKEDEVSAKKLMEYYNKHLWVVHKVRPRFRFNMKNINALKAMGIQKEKRMICKYCKEKHVVGCCEDYNRLGRTSNIIFKNIKVSYQYENDPTDVCHHDSDDD